MPHHASVPALQLRVHSLRQVSLAEPGPRFELRLDGRAPPHTIRPQHSLGIDFLPESNLPTLTVEDDLAAQVLLYLALVCTVKPH
eukprot:1320033-Rhodomonas_salina.3